MRKMIVPAIAVIILTTVSCSTSRRADYLFYDDAYYGMSDARREYNRYNRTNQGNGGNADEANNFQSANDPNYFANQGGANGNTFISNNYYSNGGFSGYNPYGFWNNPGTSMWAVNSGFNSWGGAWNSGWGNPYFGNSWNNPWNNPWDNPWNNPWNNSWNNPWHNPWNNGWNNPWNNPWNNGWNNPWGCGWGNSWSNPWNGGGFGGGGSWGPSFNGFWGPRGSVSGTIPQNYNPHFVAGFIKSTQKPIQTTGNVTPQNTGENTRPNMGSTSSGKPVTTDAVKPMDRVREPQRQQTETGKAPITRPDYNRLNTVSSQRPSQGAEKPADDRWTTPSQPDRQQQQQQPTYRPVQSQPAEQQQINRPGGQPAQQWPSQQQQFQRPSQNQSQPIQSAPAKPINRQPQNINPGRSPGGNLSAPQQQGGFQRTAPSSGGFSSPSGGSRPSGGSTPSSGGRR
jgi:hypothetical protein